VNAIAEFEAAREDLEALLIEVLTVMVDDEATPAWEQVLAPGPLVTARLAIHDQVDDSYTMVEIRAGAAVARLLASRMLGVADPLLDDLLDVMSEIGNIVGGNVKSLLRHSCRLSLPTAAVTESVRSDQLAAAQVGADPVATDVTVSAVVLGQVVELKVDVASDVTGLYWPGSMLQPVALETQS
jgi:hypothetical protein